MGHIDREEEDDHLSHGGRANFLLCYLSCLCLL